MKNKLVSYALAGLTALTVVAAPMSAMAAVNDVWPDIPQVADVVAVEIGVKESDSEGKTKVVKGGNFTLVAKLENSDKYLYQWQWQDKDGVWHNVGGGNSSVYPVTDRKPGKYIFRCAITTQYRHEVVPAKEIFVTVE